MDITAAHSADLLAAPQPIPPLAFDWSGPSVGLSLTNLWGSGSAEVPGVGKLDGLSFDGPGVGLTLGYDYQFSPAVVVGGAADVNLSTSRFSASIPGESLTAREYGSWALRGRLGTEVGEGTLAYGTVGFSQLIGDASLQGGVSGDSGRQTFNGVVFGGGVETRFDTNMFARFEYLHGVYGRQSYAGGQFSLAPSTDSARFTLVLRPDGASSVPRDAPPASWSGLYVGGLGGWEQARTAIDAAGASVVGLGAGGVSGAAVVGYDWRQERALVGVEGEVSANAAKASLTGPFGVSASASAPLEAAGRVRFGALLTASTTLYGEIGGAWTHAQASAATPGFSLSAGKDYVGAQFGLGVETMLTPHIGARVEYIETRYAKQDGFTPTTAKTQSGLIYKF